MKTIDRAMLSLSISVRATDPTDPDNPSVFLMGLIMIIMSTRVKTIESLDY